jgi:phospholipase C
LAEVRVCVEECDPKIYLKVRHDASKPAKLMVKANAYLPNKTWNIETASTEKELNWNMSDFGGWYDFTVTIEGDSSFKRRFAGRIETGKDSFSDPYMGFIES